MERSVRPIVAASPEPTGPVRQSGAFAEIPHGERLRVVPVEDGPIAMITTMIFDLDGTLVQTEQLKARSYARAAVTLRPELNEQEVIDAFRDVVGLSRRQVATRLLERFDLTATARAKMAEFGVQAPWQAYVQIRLDHYGKLLADDNVLLDHQWPHNMELLRRARRTCDKIGLATMSYCQQVQRVLSVLGLVRAFDVVASRDDVEQGKPDPEIYDLLASELDVSPDVCLVVEDSVPGVRAALAAGMHCVAVATPFTGSGLHSSGAIAERWIVDEPSELFTVVDTMMAEHQGDRA